MRILMVCLGNICRSPLAEGIMQHKIKQKGLDWIVDSAGTGHWHVGNPPDSRSIAVARKYGIDISSQRGRQFRQEDFELFDKIFVMDTSNQRDVLRLAQNDTQRALVALILSVNHPDKVLSVPDPYHDNEGFEAVFEMLDVACEAYLASH